MTINHLPTNSKLSTEMIETENIFVTIPWKRDLNPNTSLNETENF